MFVAPCSLRPQLLNPSSFIVSLWLFGFSWALFIDPFSNRKALFRDETKNKFFWIFFFYGKRICTYGVMVKAHITYKTGGFFFYFYYGEGYNIILHNNLCRCKSCVCVYVQIIFRKTLIYTLFYGTYTFTHMLEYCVILFFSFSSAIFRV